MHNDISIDQNKEKIKAWWGFTFDFIGYIVS